ncbi:MAG: M48 family metalloprotease [Acidimicrobiales bacterium]|nr:M48 family metalloprotease [Acidimicrobiales bacterium]
MSAPVPDRICDLDRRRAWARARAPLWFVLGTAMIALFNAALVLLVLAAAARFWSWTSGDGFTDSPLWEYLGPGAVAMVVGAFALSIGYLLVHVVSAAPGRVLADVGAGRLERGILTQVDNVLDGLSIGLGQPAPPELWLIDDPAPNALSLRSRRRKVLAVTSGLTTFPRDELEAVCAHEMAHLHAADAQWVTAAGSSVQRARRYARVVMAGGILLVVFLLWLADKGGLLLSPFVFGLALIALGGIASSSLGHMSRRIRSDADDLADVVAVHLCKNPLGLGRALDRIGADPRRVTHNTWRSELLWFETTEEEASVEGAARGGREVDRRAVAAYATANEQRPGEAAAAIAAASDVSGAPAAPATPDAGADPDR